MKMEGGKRRGDRGRDGKRKAYLDCGSAPTRSALVCLPPPNRTEKSARTRSVLLALPSQTRAAFAFFLDDDRSNQIDGVSRGGREGSLVSAAAAFLSLGKGGGGGVWFAWEVGKKKACAKEDLGWQVWFYNQLGRETEKGRNALENFLHTRVGQLPRVRNTPLSSSVQEFNSETHHLCYCRGVYSYITYRQDLDCRTFSHASLRGVPPSHTHLEEDVDFDSP